MPDTIDESRELLGKLGLHGLSGIIAAAILKAAESGPQVKDKLFRIIIHDVCRTALGAGIEPIELSKVATMILEISTHELVKMREEAERKKKIAELKEAQMWNVKHGL